MDIKDGKNEFSFQLTSSSNRRGEQRAAQSQLSIVSLVYLCVSLAEESLEAGHIWMFGTERTICTQGSEKEEVSLT